MKTGRSMWFVLLAGLVVAAGCPAAESDADEPVPGPRSGSHQYSPQLLDDGAGGAIAAWEDHRNGNYDVYMQRIDAGGGTMWSDAAVGVVVEPATQYNAEIVADGQGGSIVFWWDYRSDRVEIYAQRVNSAGKVSWPRGGVRVASAPHNQMTPRAVADGEGGAIVVWEDHHPGNIDLRAQRVGRDGVLLWGADGVPVATSAGDQVGPQVASDGDGGVIVVWGDHRSNVGDIYAQRISPQGRFLWREGGTPVSRAAHHRPNHDTVADGEGGVIVVWQDHRSAVAAIYGQKIDSAGKMLWAADGVPISTAPRGRSDPRLTSDGAGGAVVGWVDHRRKELDVYAQRVSRFGALLWDAADVPVSRAPGEQTEIKVVPDGTGGAVLAWKDQRREAEVDVYAQRIDGDGNVMWAADGVPVCVAANDKLRVTAMPMADRSTLFAWSDFRHGGPNNAIYVQRLGPDGAPRWVADGLPLVRKPADEIKDKRPR